MHEGVRTGAGKGSGQRETRGQATKSGAKSNVDLKSIFLVTTD